MLIKDYILENKALNINIKINTGMRCILEVCYNLKRDLLTM